MRQPSGRLSARTLPPLSSAEKAASSRGGTSPPPGRSSHGKPEPSPGRHGRARGDPPDLPGDWGEALGQSPPGHHRRAQSPPAQGPPGRASPLRVGPAPPRRGTARGDPPLRGRRPSGHTYGCKSGPLSRMGYSSHQDPPFSRQTTGPPGTTPTGMFDCRPPTWNGRPDRVPRVGRRSRGGPPGSYATDSSLSAGRRRGRIPDVRPETARHDAARKSTTTKSRKITPWL